MSIDAALRARIADFLADYAHAIDDGDLDSWPGYFTEAGRYRIITRETHDAGLPMGIMYCEGRGMMTDCIMALHTANIYEPHSYSHLLGPTRLQPDDDGGWRARTNFQVIRTMQSGAMELYAAGKYLDRIVLDDGRPLLAERDVVLESRRVDILLVFPL